MKKIIMFILVAVAFAMATNKPAANKQFHEGEWWYCTSVETDDYGTVKNYTSAEGAKYATSRDYQDGLLIRLVEYGGIERYFNRTVKEQYFNSCKDIVEENYNSPKNFNIKETFTYKYGENCQIIEKRERKMFTDDLGNNSFTYTNTKYTYKNNKIIRKTCTDWDHKTKYCETYTTITIGNKSTTYHSDKSIFKVETIIDENTKIVDWNLNEKTIYKTFKESDTKYHECWRQYLD